MVRQVELSDTVYKERDKNLDIIPMFLGFGSNNGLYVLELAVSFSSEVRFTDTSMILSSKDVTLAVLSAIPVVN